MNKILGQEYQWLVIENSIATIGLCSELFNKIHTTKIDECYETEYLQKHDEIFLIETTNGNEIIVNSQIDGEILDINKDALGNIDNLSENASKTWLMKIATGKNFQQ